MKKSAKTSASRGGVRRTPAGKRPVAQGPRRPRPAARRSASPAGRATAPPAAEPAAAPLLSERQRRHLRGLAHPLKPVVWLGNAGLTDGVAQETQRALHDHELIKVKGPGGDREARDALFTKLAQHTASTLVHRIGNIAVLYRPRAELPRILIPD